MIVRIGKGSESLNACIHYHAHDKNGCRLAETSNRVAWVVSLNLPYDTTTGSHDEQIEAMLKCAKVMQWTADHQVDIKRAAGASAAGRKLVKPGYSYSLSWAKNESPTKNEMLAAAQETIKIMKMTEHQALIVCHNDTEHSHVHIIINRVNPEHGRSASLSCNRLKLSRWAEAYEKKQGKIRVSQRVINNAAREANKKTFNRLKSSGDLQKIIKGFNLSHEERRRYAIYSSKTDTQIHDERRDAQQAERYNLEERWRKRVSLVKKEIEDYYGEDYRQMQQSLRQIDNKIGATGNFQQTIQRLTGERKRDIKARELLQKTFDNLEMRIAERKQSILNGIERERHRLTARHDNELERDAEFIAARQRRQEREDQGDGRRPKNDGERRKRTRDRSQQRREARQKDKLDRVAELKTAARRNRTRKRDRPDQD